jgi:hypothetical protein
VTYEETNGGLAKVSGNGMRDKSIKQQIILGDPQADTRAGSQVACQAVGNK